MAVCQAPVISILTTAICTTIIITIILTIPFTRFMLYPLLRYAIQRPELPTFLATAEITIILMEFIHLQHQPEPTIIQTVTEQAVG